MVMYNVKINLNNKIFFISEPKDKPIEAELFDSFIGESKKLSMNDDGAKYSKKLERFDISQDKKLGHVWTFKINNLSLPILKKTIEQYKSWGHLQWRLIGKNFSINYEECGDEYHEEFMKEGPGGKNTIGKIINIKLTKEYLPKFNSIIDKYNNYGLKNTPRKYNKSE